MHRLIWTGLLLIGLVFANRPAIAEDAKFEFQSGDRVVLLGNTLIEREQSYGYWELALTLARPDQKLTFRNLGWSGDTVWCESRGIFDQPQAGYDRTIQLVKEQKPTVLLLAYGGNEAFAGTAGLDSFLQQYAKLLDDLKPTGARLVFLGPMAIQLQGKPFPDPAPYNANAALYGEAIRKLAAERGGVYVPLTRPAATVSGPDGRPEPTSDNGQHLTEWGYWATAGQIQQALAPTSKPIELPSPAAATAPDNGSDAASQREKIRRIIVRKDELFFHRWRPQNVTYLFLFRKHEQGNNAVEIPQFDPLVEQLEAKIHDLAIGAAGK